MSYSSRLTLQTR